MTSTPQDHEDRRLRKKSAAFRLKHDVDKALRWSAPEVRETDPEALRARLASDLLPSGDRAAKRDVVQSFFEWKREEGELFDTHDDDLSALAAAAGDTDDEARLLEIAAKETPEFSRRSNASCSRGRPKRAGTGAAATGASALGLQDGASISQALEMMLTRS